MTKLTFALQDATTMLGRELMHSLRFPLLELTRFRGQVNRARS